MNRFWGHTLSVAGLAMAAGSSVPACAHDDASLFVVGVLAPPTPSGTTCTYTVNATALMLSSGIVDSGIAAGYSPLFLVGNTLIPQGNPNTPDSETSRIEIQGAVVQVTDPATGATVENATVLTASEVEPAAGSSPSYSSVGLTIMNKAAIDHFAPSAGAGSNVALVYITFFGQTLGGQNIQSNQYQFPVDVCTGCLVTLPSGAKAGYCQGEVTAAAVATACVVGQDQQSDCQFCYPHPVCSLTPCSGPGGSCP